MFKYRDIITISNRTASWMSHSSLSSGLWKRYSHADSHLQPHVGKFRWHKPYSSRPRRPAKRFSSARWTSLRPLKRLLIRR